MVDGTPSEPIIQKIIPDGYPELIFHYADPYEIDISGKWELQSLSLLAGQATRFFHLRNTGAARMFAIKLQPWTLHALFGLDASSLLDRVISLPGSGVWDAFKAIATGDQSFEEKCAATGELISVQDWDQVSVVQQIIHRILVENGMITVQELTEMVEMSERTLERYFKLHVGLSPKKYCRIIRHAYIFKVVNEKPDNWAQVAYKAGYYDQTHFIKNFQEFTGEDPSKYGFDDKTFANFFLNLK